MVRDPQKRKDFLERWHKAAEIIGIPKEAYKPRVKLVRGDSEPSYSFGVILNTFRFQRPKVDKDSDCPMCEAVIAAQSDPRLNLCPGEQLLDFIVVPNKFPFSEGSSLAITEGVRERERPLYSTRKLDGVAQEMEQVFEFGNSIGLQAIHNGDGAGASITGHEHWHFIDFEKAYSLGGWIYGFEYAEYVSSNTSNRVSKMPNFPFAHLIFNQDDPERIVSFLSGLGSQIGDSFDNGSVPHYICQGRRGILVVPRKQYSKKAAGSGDVAGHLVCKSSKEYDKADYDYCINRIGSGLFAEGEINLERLL